MRKLTLVVFIVVSLVSCRSTTNRPMRVGMLVWPAYELFYLAEHLGYYNPDSIKLVSFFTPSEAIRAYRTNQLDVMVVTNQNFLKMNDPELQDRIIMVVDYSAGSDILLANPGIQSIQELKGQRVAAEASALGVYVLLRMLEIKGMSGEDILFIPTDVAEQVTGYKDKKFDAVVTYEPFASKIQSSGAGELLNSSAMPYEISDLLIARPEVIKERKNQLTALCEGFFRARQDFLSEPEKHLHILTKREELSEKEFLEAMEGLQLLGLEDNLELFRNQGSGFYKSMHTVNEKMIQYGIVMTQYETQQMIDDSILKELSNDDQ